MGTSNSDSEDTAAGSSRIVVSNGQDVDKRYFHDVAQRMSRDADLRKISALGPPLWGIIAGATLLYTAYRASGLIRWLIRITGGVLLNPFEVGAPNWAEPLLFATVLLGMLLIVWLIARLGYLRTPWRIAKQAFRGLGRLKPLARLDNRYNLHYWHPFTSNLSDRDPLVPFAEDDDVPVTGIYSDGPHYTNIFVDAVYVRLDTDTLTLGKRASYKLYRWGRRRYLRRAAFLAPLLLLSLLIAAWRGVVDPFAHGPIATAGVVVAAALSTLLLGWIIVARDLFAFYLEFYSDSAGLSEYRALLSDDESEGESATGTREGLTNSMNGFGLLFLSRFLEAFLGDGTYDVEVDAEQVARDLVERRREKSPNTGESVESGSDGSAFPARGFGDIGPEHATAAATELLWSSVPGESLRADRSDPDVALEVTGVDYYAYQKQPISWLRRWEPVSWLMSHPEVTWLRQTPLGRIIPTEWTRRLPVVRNVLYWDDGGTDRERFVKRRAGKRSGFRLPVKKFVSVRHDLETDALDVPQSPPELLYSTDKWDEEQVHTLYLGGGEHQHAVGKLLLALKSEGVQNADILENAFAVADDASLTSRILSRMEGRLPDEPAPGEEDPEEHEGEEENTSAPTVLFPTEYFVSFVVQDGETPREFFRQETFGFFVLRHELETDRYEEEWAHVVIGLSAPDSKLGALFWKECFEEDFVFTLTDEEKQRTEHLRPDTVYFFRTRPPGAFSAFQNEPWDYEETGHLFLDTEWRQQDSIEFSASPYDPADESEQVRVDQEWEDTSDEMLSMQAYELDVKRDDTD